jgi:hypothetical protein
MKKITLILVSAALIVGGQAFAQEADSTTKIDFKTSDGQVLRIFEDTTYHGQFFPNPFAGFTLAYLAPTTAWVPNGVHRYKIEESSEFLVNAQGSPQSWLLTGENKGLATCGWIVLGGGVVWGVIVLAELATELTKGFFVISTVAIIEAAGGTPHDVPSVGGSGFLLQGLGASALVVGGLVMVLSARPHGTRTP